MEKQYKAVFFDLGGTLRIAFLEEAYMRHARRKMAEIAGTDMPYEEFYQMIEERYEPYRKWALGEFKEPEMKSCGANGCCRTMTRPGSVRCVMS